MASCLMLLLHWDRAAASRTFWTAGRSSPIRIAMIAITTNNSMSVKPRRAGDKRVTTTSGLNLVLGDTHGRVMGRAIRLSPRECYLRGARRKPGPVSLQQLFTIDTIRQIPICLTESGINNLGRDVPCPAIE